MKTSLIYFLAVFCLSSSAQNSGSGGPPQSALERIRPEGIRAHMAFLADDLLEGRGTGSRGYMIAAKYVAAQFQQMGLKPAGDNGTYFQSLRLREYKLVPEQSTMSIAHNGQLQTLTQDKECVISASPISTDLNVESDVIFVGYGVTAPEFHYDDYAGIDAKGKVVAILYGAPARFGSAPGGYYSDIPGKEANAVAHGAVGMIIVWAGPVAEHYPFPALVGFSHSPHMRWLDEKGAPNDVHPEIKGFGFLAADVGAQIFEGSPKTLNDVLAAAKAGQPQAFPLSVRVAIHTVSQLHELESSNVAAVLPGSDVKLRNEYVAFTAHLDHIGIGDPVNGDNIYNGALDNASGAATLLEVARSLTLSRPRRSLLFVAVTGEEEGLLGSDFYTHHPTVPAVIADLNMDEIPMLYDFKDIVAYGAEHSSIGKMVDAAAYRFSVEVSPDPAPEEVDFIRSDQYSFVKRGTPSVAIAGGYKAVDPALDGKKLSETWESTRYHQPSDDMNQPLDFKAAAKYAKLVLVVGYAIAQDNNRPHWNKGDFFLRFAQKSQ